MVFLDISTKVWRAWQRPVRPRPKPRDTVSLILPHPFGAPQPPLRLQEDLVAEEGDDEGEREEDGEGHPPLPTEEVPDAQDRGPDAIVHDCRGEGGRHVLHPPG